jgi:hypothetical protein
MESIAPEDWEEKMEKGEIAQNEDKMMIFGGVKKY